MDCREVRRRIIIEELHMVIEDDVPAAAKVLGCAIDINKERREKYYC